MSDNSKSSIGGLGAQDKGRPKQERFWIWALRPLERAHTPNMLCSIEEKPGSVIQMLYDKRTGAAILAAHAPETGDWQVWHRYYRPSDADISILNDSYPDEDPNNPNWLNVKRDLVCAGLDPDTLSKTEVPVLLGLLGKAKAAPATSNRKRIGFGP